ncbi:hypothetical protein HAX54_040578 [Datura stramonium]|uniref:Uncharacterized protein n=1 Tax=Datura stramonium TaxID=4076 RepID=A0ABS8VQD9_DATST|nr:hypothetical protein [Datura stramonium]
MGWDAGNFAGGEGMIDNEYGNSNRTCNQRFNAIVTAAKGIIRSQNQKLESGIAKPLKDHAFASPEKIAELLQKVGTAIDEACLGYWQK